MGCPMQKPNLGSAGGGFVSEAVDDEFLVLECPLLHEHLTALAYDDKSKRERSTLSLWVEDGKIKVSLNDKNLSASLYRSGQSILDALRAIEKAISPGGECDWRLWKKRK